MVGWGKRIISGSIGGVAAALLLCVVLTPQAQAESLNGRELREGIRRGNAQNQQPLQDPREARRPYFPRQESRDEQQRPPRLSPEERRQLRRDIKDAGREIYLRRRQ